MAVESERLEAIIDIVDQFTPKLQSLISQLAEVHVGIETVDGRNIDVNVGPARRSIAGLQAQLAALQGQMAGAAAASPAIGRGMPSGGGGGGGDLLPAAVLAMGEMVEGISRQIDTLGDAAAGAASGMGKVGETGEEAAEATGGLLQRFADFDFSMANMHNALAKVVPLLLVIIGALPALIGGLVALAGAALSAAAALAAITGLGVIGFALAEGGRGNMMESLTTLASDVFDAFLDAFQPLAEQLQPLFMDAVAGLEVFFQELADRGDTLLRFADVARDFGRFLLSWLPDAIQAMGEMAIAFRDVFGIIGDAMQNMNLAEGLTNFMAAVLPEFIRFFELLVAFLPKIAEMSIGFLALTNAIGTAVFAILEIITVGGLLNEQIGILIGMLLLALTATALWSSTLLKSLVVNLATLGSMVANTIPVIGSYITSISGAAGVTWSLNTAIAVLIGLLTLGVGALIAVGVVSTIADRFGVMASNVDDATSSLRDFQRVSRRFSGDSPYGFSGSGDISPGSARRGGDINVTINGDADEETFMTQLKNANHRQSNTSV